MKTLKPSVVNDSAADFVSSVVKMITEKQTIGSPRMELSSPAPGIIISIALQSNPSRDIYYLDGFWNIKKEAARRKASAVTIRNGIGCVHFPGEVHEIMSFIQSHFETKIQGLEISCKPRFAGHVEEIPRAAA